MPFVDMARRRPTPPNFTENMEKGENPLRAALLRLSSYCAYQERSPREVREKLASLGDFTEEEADWLQEQLEAEGFLNERRFALAYSQGKFRQLRWGRRKIAHGLREQGISGHLLEEALGSLEAEGYDDVLGELARKKWASLPGGLAWAAKRQKTLQYLLQKGYGTEEALAHLPERP
jgi:regulatory protein